MRIQITYSPSMPLLGAFVGFDLCRVLRTGRARLWMRGTATRDHQPARYWRYVYSDWGTLAFCAALLLCRIFFGDARREINLRRGAVSEINHIVWHPRFGL